MLERISSLLNENGITLFSPISLSDCTITRKYLLDRENISSGTAIMIAAPYYTSAADGALISAYATARDYHLFYRELFSRVLPVLKDEFKENKFCGFADHSPIDERDSAARSGLGVIGQNGMLITKKYSSYVFIGEIITDALLECEAQDIKYCENCGACTRACPKNDGFECLSAVTQKKGELSDAEIAYIKKYGSAWGCDICQEVCPHTIRAKKSGDIFTEIPFFCESLTPRPTPELIKSMSDEEFMKRAYSWRGRDCIVRNLSLFCEVDK